MLAPDLGRAHLPRGREADLQGPLGARGKGVNLVARIASLLAEPRTHPIHVRASAPQGLRGDVVAAHDTGEQVVRPDSCRRGSPGRSLTGSHDALPSLARKGLK